MPLGISLRKGDYFSVGTHKFWLMDFDDESCTIDSEGHEYRVSWMIRKTHLEGVTLKFANNHTEGWCEISIDAPGYKITRSNYKKGAKR